VSQCEARGNIYDDLSGTGWRQVPVEVPVLVMSPAGGQRHGRASGLDQDSDRPGPGRMSQTLPAGISNRLTDVTCPYLV